MLDILLNPKTVILATDEENFKDLTGITVTGNILSYQGIKRPDFILSETVIQHLTQQHKAVCIMTSGMRIKASTPINFTYYPSLE